MAPHRNFNAHCHLELSHLKGAIPPGLPFTEWLDRLVPLKRGRPTDESRQAAARAVREMQAAGTEAILDIDSMGTSHEGLRQHEMPALVFTEMIEFDAWLYRRALDGASSRQNAQMPLPHHVRHGLSPHAPYSTTAPLLEAAGHAARESGQWLCIHAAEFEDEVRFLLEGRGTLRDFLEARNVLPANWDPPRMRPVEFLAASGVLGPRTLLVHVNHLTDEEIALLVQTGTRAVVCPGTHIYFDRGEFPLARLLAAGVETYLGTDSLASNDALDMNLEVARAIELSPSVDPERIRSLVAPARFQDFL